MPPALQTTSRSQYAPVSLGYYRRDFCATEITSDFASCRTASDTKKFRDISTDLLILCHFEGSYNARFFRHRAHRGGACFKVGPKYPANFAIHSFGRGSGHSMSVSYQSFGISRLLDRIRTVAAAFLSCADCSRNVVWGPRFGINFLAVERVGLGHVRRLR